MARLSSSVRKETSVARSKSCFSPLRKGFSEPLDPRLHLPSSSVLQQRPRCDFDALAAEFSRQAINTTPGTNLTLGKVVCGHSLVVENSPAGVYMSRTANLLVATSPHFKGVSKFPSTAHSAPPRRSEGRAAPFQLQRHRSNRRDPWHSSAKFKSFNRSGSRPR